MDPRVRGNDFCCFWGRPRARQPCEGRGTRAGWSVGGRLALALLLAALATAASAQPAPPEPEAVVDEPDRSELREAPLATDTLRPRPAPDDVLAAYRADPDFQYGRPEAQGPSLWDRFWAWVWRTFLAPIWENTAAQIRDWMVVGLALALLAYVVARLLRVEGGGVFARSGGARAAVGPLLDVEDIEAVDLRALLGGALEREAWREAIRFRYLVLLQEMAAAGAVAWRRDKTNRTYAAEARAFSAALARPFGRATRAFDYVWYGERPVDRARYRALAPTFDEAEAALGAAPADARRQPIGA